MNLDELRAFLAVVETGSIVGAADALRVSRAALRRRLADLEAHVGVPLLARTQHGAAVTPAGEILAARGRVLVQETNALLAAIHEASSEPVGQIRMLVPVGLPPQLMALFFFQLRALHTRLELRVRFSDDPAAAPMDDVDLAFHFGPRIPVGPWITTVLFRFPERLVANRAYLEMAGTPRCIEDLAKHTLLGWAPPGEDPYRWPTREGGSFPVSLAMTSPDIHLIRQCALSGMGIGLAPDAGVPDVGFKPGDIVTVLPDVVGREGTLRALVPEALADLPKTKLILGIIRTFLGAL